MKTKSQIATLEALLFISGEALALTRLAKILSVSIEEIRVLVGNLALRYQSDPDSGLALIEHDESVRLVTRGDAAGAVEALTKSTLQEHLSRAALEVLSIIAYRAPVTRSEVEIIRGVNCSFTLRNLLLRGLIEREGNPADSRGYIYRPTFRFLEHLGLGSLRELPKYEELLRMIPD